MYSNNNTRGYSAYIDFLRNLLHILKKRVTKNEISLCYIRTRRGAVQCGVDGAAVSR